MPKDSKHAQTLLLFAYGTYKDYKKSKSTYLELKPAMLKKLQMITIAQMASENKQLRYASLKSALDISDLRQLEDLIIDCMYNELLKGKLDQKGQQVWVEYTFGRDSKQEDIGKMVAKLEDWDKQLEGAMKLVEQQIKDCNKSVENRLDKQETLKLEIQEVTEKIFKDIHDKDSSKGAPTTLGKQGSKETKGSYLSGFKPGFMT